MTNGTILTLQDKLGIKAFLDVSYPHAAIKLHFSQLDADAIRKIH